MPRHQQVRPSLTPRKRPKPPVLPFALCHISPSPPLAHVLTITTHVTTLLFRRFIQFAYD